MASQGNSGPETSSSMGTLPGCPVTPSKSASPPDSCAGGTQDTSGTESVNCLSPGSGSLSLQQNTNSSCGKTNQGFQAVSCSSAEMSQTQAVKHLSQQTDQPSQQQGPSQQQQQQAQEPPGMQHVVQQSQQLQPNSQLQQNQQQLQMSQQQLQLGQQLQQGPHMQSAGTHQLPQVQQLQPGQQSQQLQLQHPLQLQQGQQLLQQTQHIQQLLQQQQTQHQQGQQLLQNQQQVQQLLQQQQSQQQQGQQHHNQQMLHHAADQQSQGQQQLLQPTQGQEFFQHQGQPVLQQQGQPILQQQTNQQQLQQQYQQQMQHGQRFLQQPGQHLFPQQAQQPGQQQLLQPLQQQQQLNQQQLLQQVGQQQLLNSLQPSGQQLFQAVQPGQPALFQPQSGQQLLQAPLLQSQPSQALMQQQPFPVNQQQLLQQQTQQHMMQQQQLSNLQQQIVLQAIQAQGSGSGVNLSNMAGRSLSIMPSGSSIGLVNTVPANVYRQMVSSVGQGTSTTTLATQISKNNPVAGSRVSLSQSSAQRPAAMQVIQPRQNTPLFIGQFGMVSNGAIIPSGIVPLARPPVSGSVTVQASGAQSQILGSPTQIQLLGSAGNMLNPQTFQAAMAQLQQQGTSLLTSQSLYIQPAISVSSQPDGTSTPGTVAKATTPPSSIHPSSLSVSLPVQIAIGASGLGQGLQTRPMSWPAVTTTVADKSVFNLLPVDASQLKVALAPTSCSDSTLPLPMETVAFGNRVLYSGINQNCTLPLGLESHINVASSQGVLGSNSLSTSNRHDSIKPEKSQGLLSSLSDTSNGNGLAKVSGSSEGLNASGEKQTATVKPQILTHVIEGFVIQEGSEPFPVQPSSFMSEFLDSTDEMTDSSCDGQSDEETPEDKTKTMTEVEHPSAFAKNTSKLCTYCAKHYELPAFGRTGKFCSQSCAKRSAASSRWNMYHVNKRSETPTTNKTPVKRRSSNVNGRGWIRSSGNRNVTNAMGIQQRQTQTPAGVSNVQSPIPNLNPVLPKSCQQQSTTIHGPRLTSDNGTALGEHDASISFQQRTLPVQPPLASPRHDVVHQIPVPQGESRVRDADPTRKHPSEWGVQEVYSFVKSLPGCSGYAEEFRLQEIDGQALLLLKEDHLMTTLNLKLGPALKICQQIMVLKDSFS